MFLEIRLSRCISMEQKSFCNSVEVWNPTITSIVAYDLLFFCTLSQNNLWLFQPRYFPVYVRFFQPNHAHFNLTQTAGF